MNRIKFAIFGAVVGAIALPGVNDLGAAIEGALFPIVREQVTYGPYWRGREFCWRWNFEKARTGAPRDFTTVLVRLSDGREAILPAYRGDEQRPFEPEKTSRPGQESDVLVCSMMPPWIDPAQAFDVYGSVVYGRPHGLWDVRMSFPTVKWRPE